MTLWAVEEKKSNHAHFIRIFFELCQPCKKRFTKRLWLVPI